jgi:hypothetical protein
VTGTSTLQDTFSTDSLAANWPASTGVVSVTGGVAQLQCDTSTTNALKTDYDYSLRNDTFDVKIAALPVAAGATSATMQFAVTQGPVGANYLAIVIDTASNRLLAKSNGVDAIPARTYDASWRRVRIREGTAPAGNLSAGTAGRTYFDVSTADDESAWMNLGWVATPSWVSAADDSALAITCHRSSGTTGTVKVDNVNCTLPDPPGDPVVELGDAQLHVLWSPPEQTGGAPVTDYAVHISPAPPGGSPVLVGDASTELTVTGLSNGTAYTCTVRAVTDVGTGPESASASGTPAPPPNAPFGVAATAGDSSARITWEVLVAEQVDTFTVALDDGAGTVVTQDLPGTITSTLFDGLVNDTTYTVTVVATNVYGTSAPSAPATLTPVLGAPPLVPPPIDAALLPPDPVPAPEVDAGSLQFSIPGVKQAARTLTGPLRNKVGHVQGMWLEKLDNGQILYLLPSRGGLWLTGFDPGYPVIAEVTQPWPDRDGALDYTDRYGAQNLVLNLLAEPWRGIDANGVLQPAPAWAALARIWSSLDFPVRLHYQLTGQAPVYCDVRTANFAQPISGEDLGRYTIPITWGFYNAEGMTYAEVADGFDADPARPGWYLIRIPAKAIGTTALNFGGGSTWDGGAGLSFDGGSVDAPSTGINFGGESSFGSPIIAVPRATLGSRRTAPIITISGGACTGPTVSVYGATDQLTLRAKLQFSSALVLSADDLMLIDVPNRRVVRNPDRYGNGEPLYRYLTGTVDWRNFTINPSEGNGFAFDALAAGRGATASFSYRAASV